MPERLAEGVTRVPVALLRRQGGAAFALRPGPDEMRRLAEDLGLSALRKLSVQGQIVPDGDADWRVEAHLGATVVQPCVVTLAPVTTRIDEDLVRRFVRDTVVVPDGSESEMPEDETEEPLGEAIDLRDVMAEALALALPAWPRAEGAELGDARFAEPGKTPLADEELKPLAGLKALRDKLDDGG